MRLSTNPGIATTAASIRFNCSRLFIEKKLIKYYSIQFFFVTVSTKMLTLFGLQIMSEILLLFVDKFDDKIKSIVDVIEEIKFIKHY
jgi:hypothetical protein